MFFERGNYVCFLQRLCDYLRPGLDVLACCLMPTHYHFLVRLADDDLSQRMQLLPISHAKAVNRRRSRVGALFQGAFRAKHAGDDTYTSVDQRPRHRTRPGSRRAPRSGSLRGRSCSSQPDTRSI